MATLSRRVAVSTNCQLLIKNPYKKSVDASVHGSNVITQSLNDSVIGSSARKRSVEKSVRLYDGVSEECQNISKVSRATLATFP
jgi:hypothetical protein